jgi:hypothetical protein
MDEMYIIIASKKTIRPVQMGQYPVGGFANIFAKNITSSVQIVYQQFWIYIIVGIYSIALIYLYLVKRKEANPIL